MSPAPPTTVGPSFYGPLKASAVQRKTCLQFINHCNVTVIASGITLEAICKRVAHFTESKWPKDPKEE